VRRRFHALIVVLSLSVSPAAHAALPKTPPGSWTGADWMALTQEEQHAFILGAIHMAYDISLSFLSDAVQREQLIRQFAQDWDPESVTAIVQTLNRYIEVHGTDGLLFDLLDACCSELWR